MELGSDHDLDSLIEQAGGTHVIPHREDPAVLEQLRDPRVLARARSLLTARDETSRHAAILCIERIGYVLRDQETAELLLDFAYRTRDRYERDAALLGLASLTPPRPVPAAPLLDLVRRGGRPSPPAIGCLHLAPADEVEPLLLGLADDADPIVPIYVARQLGRLVSEDSLAALVRLLEHRGADVRGVALVALARRLGPAVLPHARRSLRGPRAVQTLAFRYVCEHGDVSDLPAVLGRLKKLPGARLQYEPPEVSALVPFVLRFRADPRAAAALERLGRAVGGLPPNERRWLEHHAPEVLARSTRDVA